MKNCQPNYSSKARPFTIPTRCLAVIMLLAAVSSQGASKTWSGGGSDNYWSTGANWDGTAPVNWDTLTFSGSSRKTNTNDIPALFIGSVTFSTSGWRIGSTNLITKTNDFIYNVSGTNIWEADTIVTQTVSAAVTKFTANDYTARLEMRGQISGVGAITKTAGANGRGSLFLACPTNSFTGLANLGTGQTDATAFANKGVPSSFGQGTGTITIGSTASGYTTWFNYVGVSDGTTDRLIDLQTRDGGSLYFSNNSPNNASLTFNSGMQCRGYNKDGYIYLGGSSTGTNTISSFTQVKGSDTVMRNMTLTVYGPGTWALNGAASSAGDTILNSGTLVLGPLGSMACTNIILALGATWNVDAIAGGFPLGANGTQNLKAGYGTNNSAPNDIIGSLTLGYYGAINVGGAGSAGSLKISSNLTFAAAAGRIQFDLADQPTVGSGVNDLIVAGGNLELGYMGTLSINPYKGTLATDVPYTLVKYAGDFTGDPAYLAVPAPARGYTASLSTNTPHELRVIFQPSGQSAANLTWQGMYGFDWDAATTLNWLNHGTNDVFLQGDAVTFNDASAMSYSINLVSSVFPSAITLDTTNLFTFGGPGSFNGDPSVTLTKRGTGTVVIGTANGLAGDTTVGAGTVLVAHSSALGTGTVVMGNTSTGTNDVVFLYNGASSPANAIHVTTNGTGRVILGRESGNAGGFAGPILLERGLILTNSGIYTGTNLCLLSGNISGQGDITMIGGGFHRWTGNNSFSGNVTLADPGIVFQVTGGSALPDTANVTLASNTVFVVFGNETINGLNGVGIVRPVQTSYTLTVGGGDGSGNFSGFMSNNTETSFAVLSLRKAGLGTQILSGDNSLSTGNTTVAGGTLAINNTVGSGTPLGSVSVQASGTLAGNGTISSSSNNITVNGTLSVGNAGDTSAAVLTIDNASFSASPGRLIVDSGAVSVDLFTGAGEGDNTAKPAAADQLNVTCAVQLNAASTLTVANPKGLVGFAVGDKWKIIRWASAPVGSFGIINLPNLGTSLTWDVSALYVDGTISVITRPPLPSIGYAPATNGMTLTWTGNALLQAAPEVTGPYTNILGATSPFVVTNLVDPAAFYRLMIPW